MNSPIPGSDAIPRLATQRAIGWSRVKTKNTKKGQITTKESVEIQAWELAAIGVAGALLIYLTGSVPGIPGSSSGSSSGSPNIQTGGPGLFHIGPYSFGGLSYL